MKMKRIACLFVYCGLVGFHASVEARSVEFGLTAEWPTWEVSPLQEAAEFLAAEVDEGAPLFWEFVESFKSADSSRVDRAVFGGGGGAPLYNTSEHDAMWALTLEHSSHLLPQLSRALLQLYLAMRVYAPMLELHRSLRKGLNFDKALQDRDKSGCEASSVSWAVIAGGQDGEDVVLCGLHALQERIEGLATSQEQTCRAEGSCRTADEVGLPSSESAGATYAFDHLYPSPSTSAAPIVILYSVIGTSDFIRYHTLLSRQATLGRIKYVLRHFTPPGITHGRSIPTALQGYGIFLDIKNMEYKNLDDSAPKVEGKEGEGGGDLAATTFPLDEEVAGLNFAKLAGKRPTLIAEFTKLRHNLKEEADTASGTNMKVWRMRDLGIQSTQTILAARDPLRKLLDLSQNFPSHATPLSSLRTKDDLRNAVIANLQSHVLSLGAQPSGSLFVNGVEFPVHNPNLNVFDLIKGIRDEVLLLQRVRSHVQLSPSALSMLLQLSTAPLDDGEEEVDLSNVRIDIYRGSKALHYFNNIEKDPQYARWPRSLQQLLFPSWQLQAVRRNLYTFTLVVDPLQPGATTALAMMQDMLEKHFPVRISVLLLSTQQVELARRNTSILEIPATVDQHPLYHGLAVREGNIAEVDAILQGSDVVARLFSVAKDKHGIQTAAAFIFLIGSSEVGSYKDVVDAYVEAVARSKGTSGWSNQRGSFSQEAWKAIKGGEGREGAQEMLKLVVQKNLPVPCFLLNGALTKGLEVEQNIIMLLGREQHLLARRVTEGRLHDSSKSILGSVLVGPSVFSRYHPLLDESFRSSTARSVTLLGLQAQALVGRLPFLRPPASSGDALERVSLLLAVDLCSPDGLTSLAAALRFLLAPQNAKKGTLRLAAVHSGPEHCQRSTLIPALLHKVATGSGGSDSASALMAIMAVCQSLALQPHEDALTVAASLRDTHAWLKEHQLQKLLEASIDIYLGEGVQSLLQLKAGEEAVLVNGRLVPLSNGVLQVEDLSVIVQVEGRTFTSDAIAAVITEALPGNSTRQQSDVLLSAQSFLHTYASNPRVDVEGELSRLPDRRLLLDLRPQPPALAVTVAKRDPLLDMLDIVVVLDPLSQAARRLGPLLMVIRDHLQIPLRVLLAPDPEILEFPLKSYYRFALFPSREATRVIFQSLPAKHILTTRVDVPEPWNVQTKWALQDLDNLRCDKTSQGHCGDVVDFHGRPNGPQHTTAELTLKNMLIYGQCFDAKLGNYAHGLQVVLWDAVNSTHRLSDTLVMQNLGYFQLQAQPGVWRLRLAPGRAEELYEIVEDRGATLARVPEQELLVITKDFNQVVDRVRVRKQAGKEHIPLLDDMVSEDGSPTASETDQEERSGMWSALSSVWGSTGATGAKAPGAPVQNETVHVFSLATGHLYERMLKIMMLSVTKRTSVPVKFWLLENFLSPAFKESARFMADTLGFEVEFVTYKWPNWLRQQTEKQRIIWGYKILFLDVLFPLHVKKVIYVDADQVLRADLKELWDMDLKGKPYAYTPFCTSREETLGFQFWRQGYWKNHLQGRPYHISALYVVDLARFRRMGVGDRLRAIYDQLSRDPNSLSNLDQDLPNYAQHMVPIHSLPQEWLWCESWCSDESKADAKTIDLCNNPRYKENKLDMARRVVSGGLFNESWVELDEEVREIEERWRHVPVVDTEA